MAGRSTGPTNRLEHVALDRAGNRNPVQRVNISGLNAINSGQGVSALGLIVVITESKEDITQAGMDIYYENAFGVAPTNDVLVVVKSSNFSQPDQQDLSLWEYNSGWTFIAITEGEEIITP